MIWTWWIRSAPGAPLLVTFFWISCALQVGGLVDFCFWRHERSREVQALDRQQADKVSVKKFRGSVTTSLLRASLEDDVAAVQRAARSKDTSTQSLYDVLTKISAASDSWERYASKVAQAAWAGRTGAALQSLLALLVSCNTVCSPIHIILSYCFCDTGSVHIRCEILAAAAIQQNIINEGCYNG